MQDPVCCYVIKRTNESHSFGRLMHSYERNLRARGNPFCDNMLQCYTRNPQAPVLVKHALPTALLKVWPCSEQREGKSQLRISQGWGGRMRRCMSAAVERACTRTRRPGKDDIDGVSQELVNNDPLPRIRCCKLRPAIGDEVCTTHLSFL